MRITNYLLALLISLCLLIIMFHRPKKQLEYVTKVVTTTKTDTLIVVRDTVIYDTVPKLVYVKDTISTDSSTIYVSNFTDSISSIDIFTNVQGKLLEQHIKTTFTLPLTTYYITDSVIINTTNTKYIKENVISMTFQAGNETFAPGIMIKNKQDWTYGINYNLVSQNNRINLFLGVPIIKY